ncbi:uncharacterized protein [Rutidosis leptorrhynchoides]|uniref:uncharacterized protein n=1 Tax=Rutidosis leptorrhynchoides TaxID=125765 RepID=UPI003A99D6EF
MDPHSFIARAEAQRWIGISEKLLLSHDFVGSKTFAIRARESDPRLEAADQILAITDTLLAAEKRLVGSNGNQQPDYYAILQLVQFDQDTDHITSQYRRLAVILNPHHNRFPYSDQAFQLINDAWAVLSNPMRKSMYDSQLDFRHQPPQVNNLGFDTEQHHQHQHQQQHPRQHHNPNPSQHHHHQQQQQQQHNFFSINQELAEPQQTFQTRLQHNFLSQPNAVVPEQQDQLFHHQDQQEQLFQPQVQPFHVTSTPHQQTRPSPQPPQTQPPPPIQSPPRPTVAATPSPFSWPQAPPLSQPQQQTQHVKLEQQRQTQLQQQQQKQQREQERRLQEQREQERRLQEQRDQERQLQEQREQEQRKLKEREQEQRRLQEQREQERKLQEQREHERKLQEQREHERRLQEQREHERRLQEQRDQEQRQLQEQREHERRLQEQRDQERRQLQEQRDQERRLQEQHEQEQRQLQEKRDRERLLQEQREQERQQQEMHEQEQRKQHEQQQQEPLVGFVSQVSSNINGVNEEETEVEIEAEPEEVTEDVDDDSPTFWTTCPYCFYMYEYPSLYSDCTLRCVNCKRAFQAVRISTPPVIVDGQEAYFYSWGFIPVGVSMSHMQQTKNNKGAATSKWTPFSPLYDASNKNNGQNHLNECAAPKVNTFVNKSSGPRIYFDDYTDDVLNGVSEPSDDSDVEWGISSSVKRKSTRMKKDDLVQSFKERVQVLGLGAISNPKNGGFNKPSIPVQETASVAEAIKKNKSVNNNNNNTNNNPRKQSGGVIAKNLGKLDLNVEFNSNNNNEGEEPGRRMTGMTRAHVHGEEENIEGNGFFEGLDEFLSSLPILSAVDEQKVKVAA